VARIISVANHKGGVGKTTCAVNLAWEFSRKKRLLLIDADPQGNSTTHLGLIKHEQPISLLDVLTEKHSVVEAITPIDSNLSIITAKPSLHYVHLDHHRVLEQAIRSVVDDYDIILIDCAPSMSVLTINCFFVSNYLITPIENGFLALEGLNDLLMTIQDINNNYAASLELLTIVPNMVDWRNRLTHEIFAQLKRHFPGQLAKTSIPRNIRLAEAPSHGVPIAVYDPLCAGALAFEQLAKELLKKLSLLKQKEKA
jgi:chromosome partitioning protein